MPDSTLEPHWFARSPIDVARDLIGCLLLRRVGLTIMSGIIVETEAYLSQDDSASHAARGPGKSNASMFQAAGRCYVYPIHSRHCFNVVTENEGQGSAVLIRAVEPRQGIERMTANRNGKPIDQLTNGPGKICEAMEIDRRDDGRLLVPDNGIWMTRVDEPARYISSIKTTVRIGVTSAKDAELRFVLHDSAFASGPRSMR